MSGDPDPDVRDLRIDVPHAARIYDFLLGGKDNFESDRAAAAGITVDWPNLAKSMRANRDFMRRVGRYLAVYNANGIPTRARSKAEVEALFTGLDLVEPGIVLVNHWWPDDETPAAIDAHVHMYGGIGIKP